MYKTTLAAASLALCAAMPFTASAQVSRILPTTTELRVFCADAVFGQKTVIQDLPTIVNESLGGRIGYAECLGAVATMLKEDKETVLFFGYVDWMENEQLHKFINYYICLNRVLSRWEYGACEEFMDSLEAE